MTTSNRAPDKSKGQPVRLFDFGSNLDPKGEKTATIKDLLAEMNSERLLADGSVYDLKSLGTVLRFLTSITGRNYRSISEKLPLSTLKTIKLLHKKSRHIDAHLMRLIEPPGDNSPELFDFLTTPASEKAEDVKRMIRAMIGELSKEIDPTELDLINQLADQKQLRENFRRQTNSAIDEILLTHIHIDDSLLTKADPFLAEKTRQFIACRSPLVREPRTHVATCVYLSTLEYLHQLHFEISTEISIPKGIDVSNNDVDFGNLCAAASKQAGRNLSIETNFLSFYEMKDFCLTHTSELVAATNKLTGLDYDNRALRNDIVRTQLVMGIYLIHADIPINAETRPIGIAHLIASIASILHQRRMKANLVKKSVKYTNAVADPQRQLDQFITEMTKYIPATTQIIYRERMKFYLHTLLNRVKINESHKAFQIAQSELTRDIFLSLDPERIHGLFMDYRDHMVSAVREFITTHGRQDIQYVWKKYSTASS